MLQAYGTTTENSAPQVTLPAEKFDLSHWQINTLTDTDKDGIGIAPLAEQNTLFI